MKHLSISTLAAITALLFVACSSGGSNNPLPDNAAQLSGIARTNGKAAVSILFRWPKHSIKTERHPQFISPSTMSVVISVTSPGGGKTTTTIANYSGAPSTEIRIEAPVGVDTFVAQLWDKPEKAGRAPAGQELGEGDVTQKVVGGKVNTVNFTVSGIVAKLGFALTPKSLPAIVDGKPGDEILTLFSGFTGTIVATPLDADGNTIIAPGVVPSISLVAGTESTGGLTVTQTQATNTFDVTENAASVNGTYGLIATAHGAENVTVTQPLPVTISTLGPYVGYASGSGTKIVLYDPEGNIVALGKNAFAGVTNPIGLAYDSDDQQLLVADASGKLLAFDNLGNPKSTFPAQSVPGITAITYLNATWGPGGLKPGPVANQHRVIVTGTSGITEYDATSGQEIVQTPLSFTPTSVVGMYDYTGEWTKPASCSTGSWSSWDVLVGNPSGPSLEPYDLVTLKPLPSPYDWLSCVTSTAVSSVLGLKGDTPYAVVGVPNFYQGTRGAYVYYSGPDTCVNGNEINGNTGAAGSCLYVLSGATSHVDRLTGGSAYPFDEAALASPAPSSIPTAPPNVTFAQAAASGSLVAGAFDPLNFELYVVQEKQNAIAAFTIVDYCNHDSNSPSFLECFFDLTPAGTITTPASAGLSNPESVAFPASQGPPQNLGSAAKGKGIPRR